MATCVNKIFAKKIFWFETLKEMIIVMGGNDYSRSRNSGLRPMTLIRFAFLVNTALRIQKPLKGFMFSSPVANDKLLKTIG